MATLTANITAHRIKPLLICLLAKLSIASPSLIRGNGTPETPPFLAPCTAAPIHPLHQRRIVTPWERPPSATQCGCCMSLWSEAQSHRRGATMHYAIRRYSQQQRAWPAAGKVRIRETTWSTRCWWLLCSFPMRQDRGLYRWTFRLGIGSATPEPGRSPACPWPPHSHAVGWKWDSGCGAYGHHHEQAEREQFGPGLDPNFGTQCRLRAAMVYEAVKEYLERGAERSCSSTRKTCPNDLKARPGLRDGSFLANLRFVWVYEKIALGNSNCTRC